MVKNLPTNAGDTGDLGLIPAFGKIPWMRKLLPTPVFLPGRFHEQKSLVANNSWSYKESDMAEHAHVYLK